MVSFSPQTSGNNQIRYVFVVLTHPNHRSTWISVPSVTIGIILYCSIIVVLIAYLRWLIDGEWKDDILLSTGLILWCILQIVAVGLPFLLILFVVCSIPRHYDNFGISREVSWTAVCYAVCLVTATLFNIWIIRYHDTINKNLFSAVELVMLMLWRVSFFGIAMLQVLHRNLRLKFIQNFHWKMTGNFHILLWLKFRRNIPSTNSGIF